MIQSLYLARVSTFCPKRKPALHQERNLDHKDPAETVKTLRNQRHQQRNPESWGSGSGTGPGLATGWGAIAHTTETCSQNLTEKISKSTLRKRKTKRKWRKIIKKKKIRKKKGNLLIQLFRYKVCSNPSYINCSKGWTVLQTWYFHDLFFCHGKEIDE